MDNNIESLPSPKISINKVIHGYEIKPNLKILKRYFPFIFKKGFMYHWNDSQYNDLKSRIEKFIDQQGQFKNKLKTAMDELVFLGHYIKECSEWKDWNTIEDQRERLKNYLFLKSIYNSYSKHIKNLHKSGLRHIDKIVFKDIEGNSFPVDDFGIIDIILVQTFKAFFVGEDSHTIEGLNKEIQVLQKSLGSHVKDPWQKEQENFSFGLKNYLKTELNIDFKAGLIMVGELLYEFGLPLVGQNSEPIKSELYYNTLNERLRSVRN